MFYVQQQEKQQRAPKESLRDPWTIHSFFWTLRLSCLSLRSVFKERSWEHWIRAFPCWSVMDPRPLWVYEAAVLEGERHVLETCPSSMGLRVGAMLLRCIRGLLVLIRPKAREHRTTASKVRYTSMADVKMSACSGGPSPRAWGLEGRENELQNKEPFQCLIRTSWCLLVYHSNGEYTAKYCK